MDIRVSNTPLAKTKRLHWSTSINKVKINLVCPMDKTIMKENIKVKIKIYGKVLPKNAQQIYRSKHT